MNDYMFKMFIVYVDDINAFSTTTKIDEHIAIMEKVFQRLLSIGLKLNPSKRTFYINRAICFLCYL